MCAAVIAKRKSALGYFLLIWKYTFGRIGEDWLFLALLGTLMATLSFVLDQIIKTLIKSRITLFKSKQLGNDYLVMRYFLWTMPSILLILFASGFVHLVSPQAVGSGIPEMKTILRGVVLKEYLTFKTLVAKMVGLAMALGSGLPLGKEGPFVHIASIVATLLSRLVASFKGIYENESRTGEMLSAACAIGVASTFYSPIGGVLFSIEVTSVYFAVRNYWRGFFAACCGAAVWRLLVVWIVQEEESITALFSTNFSSDMPFDPQELIIFCMIGVICGFAGAGYVSFHRQIVKFNRRYLKFRILQRNRFIYPFAVAWLITSFSFPDFLGKYTAALVSTHDSVEHFFSNKTWLSENPDTETKEILKHWQTEDTNIFFHLGLYILMTWWTSALASTIAVPSGVFIPVLKIGAAFGRFAGELTSLVLQGSVRFGSNRIPIIPGGYAVVAAAAFSGAVTHTISTTVILFELTGQMTHIIPVIAAVLISNAIAQSLESSIYDSIIQIKQLPFLPPIASTSSAGHHIVAEDFMIRDVICIWTKCNYRELAEILTKHASITCFPLVENLESMILLGSIHRNELLYILNQQIGRERRLEEFNRKNTPSNLGGSMSALSDSNGRSSREGNSHNGHDDNNNEDDLEDISLQVPDLKEIKAKTVSTSKLDKQSVDKQPAGNSQASLLKRINSFNRKPSRFQLSAISQMANEAASQSQVDLSTLKNSRSEPSSPKPSNQKNFLTPRMPKSILKHNNSAATLAPYSNYSQYTQPPPEFKFNAALEKLFLLGKHKDTKLTKTAREELATHSLPTTPFSNRKVKLPKERVIDMSPEEQKDWEEKQLDGLIDLNNCHIDPAPFQLVGHTSLLKVHTLFTMLQLNHTYVTSIGRLVGIVALKDLRVAIERMNSGALVPKYRPALHTPTTADLVESTIGTMIDPDGKSFAELSETVVESPTK